MIYFTEITDRRTRENNLVKIVVCSDGESNRMPPVCKELCDCVIELKDGFTIKKDRTDFMGNRSFNAEERLLMQYAIVHKALTDGICFENRKTFEPYFIKLITSQDNIEEISQGELKLVIMKYANRISQISETTGYNPSHIVVSLSDYKLLSSNRVIDCKANGAYLLGCKVVLG